MWEQVEIVVGGARHRGRFKLDGGKIILEWRGGRTTTWCGLLKPEIVAANHLKSLASRGPIAA